MEHLQIEGRIVGENTGRIIMDMESIGHGFHDDRPFLSAMIQWRLAAKASTD